ncbi:hypothetical protein M2352_004117 [Azospirillum fermentarium]|uniref:hypothetical protein n=1 Tax=Azospirillum fermentarium TaxID=1233114 RepID=UPI002225D6E3|nr:hypothetical protein [Azospirillum fermentarium]MCW2248457.1 hypothetical protein [Azospirillum fermentarium]
MPLPAYLRRFTLGLLAYGTALFMSRILLQGGLEQPWLTAVALLPMVPATGLCAVIVRQVRRMDELQRRVQVEALALAFAGTALITFSYGFLEGTGLPRLSMFTVWPLMAALWVGALLLVSRRYA